MKLLNEKIKYRLGQISALTATGLFCVISIVLKNYLALGGYGLSFIILVLFYIYDEIIENENKE